MSEDDILETIKDLKANAGFVLETRKRQVVDSNTLKPLGYVWMLRLDTKYEYDCLDLDSIRQDTGADSMCIEYRRGLWIKLYFTNDDMSLASVAGKAL